MVAVFLILGALQTFAAQRAVVIVEGAMVYEKPDFDSSVIGYLPRGKRLQVSSKNFGPFHRLRFREGVLGYISDVDVASENGTPLSVANSGDPAKSKEGRRSGDKTTKPRPSSTTSSQNLKKPVNNATSLGPVVNYILYKEIINRRELSEGFWTYGARFSSRAPFLSGPFGLEVTFVMNQKAPSYWQKAVGAVASQANYYFLDFVWTFPVVSLAGKNAVISAGVGPSLFVTDAKARVNGQEFIQKDNVVGASLQLGVAFRVGPLIPKIDVKYFLEKSFYPGFLGSMQYEF